MNLKWTVFSGTGSRKEWCLGIQDRDSEYDDRVMAVIVRRGHRLYEIEWWESPKRCEGHVVVFEGSLTEAQAYAVALVRMA